MTDPDPMMSLNQHFQEIFHRSLKIGIVGVATVAWGYYAGDLAAPFAGLLGFSIPGHSASFLDRVLWASLFALPIVNSMVLLNFYGFIAPGLYRSERRTALPLLVWALVSPLLAVAVVKAYILLSCRATLPQLMTAGAARVWIFRAYVILLLCSLAFSLPHILAFFLEISRLRRFRIMSGTIVGTTMGVAVCLVPDHVVETSMLIGPEFCLVLVIACPSALLWLRRRERG